ncbi:sigma-70 family RNA polymerase sigma factor [Sphaerisporangium rubeum]|uniref:RNA polymerase sigma-70 factor (ECF subfamily) n=1 Tax=Sphaerisporangium rubeum TaxID=321317 RepID=A0A7X0M7M9_9ACTN|nr:RNA polymerase sigma-70 factor (ECF subfamily) [Sphaerisporangium rubeum]
MTRPGATAVAPEHAFAAHRVELTGFCYRMIGSAADAEDAVQETMVRAWRAWDRYDEARASVRTWLFAIAANVCADMLRGRARRAVPMDLGPAARPGSPVGEPLPAHAWVQPVHDDRVIGTGGDPADVVVARESIRLAFVAALQRLPPRQRAVLILRDVLAWTSAEVVTLLGGTVASVNSALQRARATMRDHLPAGPPPPPDPVRAELSRRYAAAFERHDVEALVALLHEDATMSMPPFPWWLRGVADIRQALLHSDFCRGSRLLPTAANGCAAFGHYVPADRDGVSEGPGRHRPWALIVVEARDGRFAAVHSFLDAAHDLPRFGLPAFLP